MKAIYEELLRKIPDYKEFLTAQELDESSFALAKESARPRKDAPFSA